MKMKKLVSVLIAALMAVCLFAQVGPDATKEDQSQKENSDVKNIQLAYSLADYGYENGSASALLEAADILSQIPTQKGEFESELKGEKGEDSTAEVRDYSPKKILEDARKFAGKDKNMLNWANKIEKVLNSTARGASGGPLWDASIAYGNGGVIYHIYFDGGRLAEVFVTSLDGADFDMYIYDSRGNLLCYDERYNRDAYGFWYPRYTDRYTIRIVNRSRYNSAYMMYTN